MTAIFPKISTIRWFCIAPALVLFLSACSPSGMSVSTTTPTTPPAQRLPTAKPDAFSYLPEAARSATRVGDPRPPAYWALWNSCAPENRAETARANGGRAAGWILMDDLLADPGITLGDFLVAGCDEGLALLQEKPITGEESADPIYDLAAALLAAELNLNVGAETCPAADEAVIGGHLVLSQVGFNGAGEYTGSASPEISNAIPQLIELLIGYNQGELCR